MANFQVNKFSMGSTLLYFKVLSLSHNKMTCTDYGNTLLADPMKIFLPDLKIFQAEFSHEIQEDKRIQFDLQRIANITKDDSTAYGSLTHVTVQNWQSFQNHVQQSDE